MKEGAESGSADMAKKPLKSTVSMFRLLELLESEAQQHTRAAARLRRLIVELRGTANTQRKDAPDGPVQR